MSLIVVGVLASFTARGTFAVLNGSTSHPNTSISTGSILMANSVAGGSNCYSDLVAANKNVNSSCTQPFSTGLLYPITSSTPPATPQTTVAYADMTISSAGLPLAGGNPTSSTLPATLMITMPNCDASNTTGAAFTGGTNPCCPGDAFGAGVLPGSVANCPSGSLAFFIQEYTSSAFTTPTGSCAYPVQASACTFQSDTLGNFFGNYHDTTHYLSLGSIAAGTSRYFRIGVAEPINASNNLQGETATLSLYWHMEQ
ncbi:MAG TPA: hypothetical protein VKR23_11360 [Gaiellaceae bacterium]|nr:hypothetical protein [Gaiellaceae bacterium]